MGAGSGDLSGLEHRGLSFTLLIYNLPDVGLPLESDQSRICVIRMSQFFIQPSVKGGHKCYDRE